MMQRPGGPVTTRQAPRKTISLSLTAILSLGLASVSAFAANETQVPCPQLAAHTDAALHEILDGDSSPNTLQTIDPTNIATLPALAEMNAEPTDLAVNETDPSDEATIRNTEIPDIATRLPGVSSEDMPRFRRYMLRTDI
jgi:hypothetical protein